MTPWRRWFWIGGLFILLPLLVLAVSEEELLSPEQAFVPALSAPNPDSVVMTWSIAEGYYLYRQRFHFETATPGFRLGEPRFPAGQTKTDAFFGEMEIYRGNVAIEIPVSRAPDAPWRLALNVRFQGCADAGVCYPPQTRTLTVELPPRSQPAGLATLSTLGQANGFGQSQSDLPEPDQAFILSVTAPDPQSIVARWTIASCCYLYRDKLKLSLVDAPEITIKAVDIPAGEYEEDEFFGRQQVFRGQATVTARLQREPGGPRDILVRADYQGCAEIGVCYPPLSQTVPVTLAALSSPPTPPVSVVSAEPVIEAEQDRLARRLTQERFWSLPAFFGFGLLLAFTPCVFPMVPILSSLIAGQGKALTQGRAVALSLTYVMAMAVTYTAAGVLAAFLGENLQAAFQNPIVIMAFSVLFVLLALSMFGFYDLQLPVHWQSRLTEVSNRRRGGSYLGVAAMGLLSALIVGPCVAPPLIGVLTVIAATGDVLLGGSALFAMSLGMGAPLLLIGSSTGSWLPRTGHWMERIKAVFGVLLLAVAIWMLERVIPTAVSMLLWAVLLIVSATYMGALQPIPHGGPSWRILARGLGVVMLTYGVLMLAGVAAGGKDPLQPLKGVTLLSSNSAMPGQVPFRSVKTLAELENALAEAGERQVMLDIYADWCVSCKELEKYTFTDPAVLAALDDALLLRADVTANDEADKALMSRFNIIGPPAILFFGTEGVEQRPYRVVGFMPPDKFKQHVEQALSSR